MNELTVLTFNVSTDENYIKMLQRDKRYSHMNSEESRIHRDQTAKVAFETLIEATSLDILFLQQVGSDLDRIKNWLGDDFEIKSDGKNTAIAYRSRFEVLYSYFSKNHTFTILSLQDKLTQKIYNVASANIANFNLQNPEENRSNIDKGVDELKDLLNKLNEFKADGTIIGLDANIDKKHHPNRFDILQKEGFQTNTSDNSPTVFNEVLKKTIKSNYIFTKGFHFKDLEKLFLAFEDPFKNPSDQRPVIEKLEITNLDIPPTRPLPQMPQKTKSSTSSPTSSSDKAKNQKPNIFQTPDKIPTSNFEQAKKVLEKLPLQSPQSPTSSKTTKKEKTSLETTPKSKTKKRNQKDLNVTRQDLLAEIRNRGKEEINPPKEEENKSSCLKTTMVTTAYLTLVVVLPVLAGYYYT